MVRTLTENATEPTPPAYPIRRVRLFVIVFYGVVVFQAVIIAVLISIYPDDYLRHVWDLFYSELGAPVSAFDTPNRIGALVFSWNMIGAAIGCAIFIPVVQRLFPTAAHGFYRRLRSLYLACIGMVSFGSIGVAFPYTDYWGLHVIGAFVCMTGLWIGWTLFVLFNSPWWSLRSRLAMVAAVGVILLFVIISELSGWHQEFFQKPGQGLVFGLVCLWPGLSYVHLRKRKTRSGVKRPE